MDTLVIEYQAKSIPHMAIPRNKIVYYNYMLKVQ